MSQGKCNILTITDSEVANAATEIESDINTMSALGYSLVSAQNIVLTDVASGAPKWLVFLTYNKSANKGQGIEGVEYESAGPFIDATVGIAASQPVAGLAAETTHVLITVDGADIRVRFDGTAPTGSVGHLISSGTSMLWTRGIAESAKMIRDALVDASVSITQLK